MLVNGIVLMRYANQETLLQKYHSLLIVQLEQMKLLVGVLKDVSSYPISACVLLV